MGKFIYLLTCGDGSDGNEWELISIHSTFELATVAKKKYEAPKTRDDGSTYNYESYIEEWVVDK